MQREPAAHAAEKVPEEGVRVKYLPSFTIGVLMYSARLQNPGVTRPGFAAPVRIPQIDAYQHGAI